MSEIRGAVRPFCVAIDYDDTFSTCPETWGKVIEVLRQAGARVFCVTFRRPDMVVTDFPGEVFYTAGRLKADFMHDLKQDVHVWVDDRPELIGENPERRRFREILNEAV
ncbi:hypothetical protein [Bradyrhizobium uaiense]|uniref:HAD family hydrolase n=1 Tax=Bradyrhizobium uaiense TaxID=2594946 RepID=A0A6P1B957_9BRAD|nr:hypothetical protein [Bradyrhizobium uaiense]NEU94804.1 hypothetical protein [Bradyrhizobium uaiense]